MTTTQFVRLSRLSFFFAAFTLLFVFSASAQKRKAAPAKTPAAKTRTKPDGKTNTAVTDKSKPAKSASNKETAAARAEKARQLAAARQAAEARRQAALAEQRRRDQIRREAAARAAAVERAFHTETISNIGSDNVEGEDLQIRRAAVESLGRHAGTVVVMEAKTGKVLTIVNQDWGIRKGFKPCSTIKLVSAVAGVNENLINENGGLARQPSAIKLDDALAHSDNRYFQKVGANLGNEKMISYARALGLGEPTGINAEGEVAGKLPYNNNNARIYSHGDDFEVTPLQLAVLVTAIANGGKLVVPQIPRTKIEKANFQGLMRREANVPPETLVSLHAGMRGATVYGTAGRAGIGGMGAAGKTGSCIMNGAWVGLFTSVAPIENPQYTIVVITRGQGERGKVAAIIAGGIYRALQSRINKKPDEVLLAKMSPKIKPNHQNDPRLKKQIADEDDDDEVVEGENSTVSKNIEINPKKGMTRENAAEVVIVGAGDKKDEVIFEPVVEVKKPGLPAKVASPLFPPVIIENKRGASDETQTESPKPSRPRLVKTNK